MSPGQAVRLALKNDAAVKAIAGERFYPSRMPQNVALPAGVYTVVSSVPESALDTPDDEALKQSRVQVDCYAKDYEDAHALAEAVVTCLTNLDDQELRVELSDSRDLFDNELTLHRVSIDFWVWSA